MQFTIPVELVGYDGRKHMATMKFEHSAEREFALTVNRKAIEDCSSLEALKPVTKNLLEGWSSMQTAVQSLTLENIQLRQAMAKQQVDLKAAEKLICEASELIDKLQCEQQSKQSKRRLWPFG